MTLFDAEPYRDPNIKKRKPRTRKRFECCAAWEDFEVPNGTRSRWAKLHALGHSRVGFTTDYVRCLLAISMVEAESMTKTADELGWISEGYLDGAVLRGSGPMWVGALAKR